MIRKEPPIQESASPLPLQGINMRGEDNGIALSHPPSNEGAAQRGACLNRTQDTQGTGAGVGEWEELGGCWGTDTVNL